MILIEDIIVKINWNFEMNMMKKNLTSLGHF